MLPLTLAIRLAANCCCPATALPDGSPGCSSSKEPCDESGAEAPYQIPDHDDSFTSLAAVIPAVSCSWLSSLLFIHEIQKENEEQHAVAAAGSRLGGPDPM
eukprot:GHVU01064962.1.p3 GENE.GHVU01064962.1~~GHVU01064962.1.p3  ORF type:complete len:101 (-),score=8.23 GHVU01064962.1:65-367(-)